jgi:hypothetical protein
MVALRNLCRVQQLTVAASAILIADGMMNCDAIARRVNDRGKRQAGTATWLSNGAPVVRNVTSSLLTV